MSDYGPVVDAAIVIIALISIVNQITLIREVRRLRRIVEPILADPFGAMLGMLRKVSVRLLSDKEFQDSVAPIVVWLSTLAGKSLKETLLNLTPQERAAAMQQAATGGGVVGAASAFLPAGLRKYLPILSLFTGSGDSAKRKVPDNASNTQPTMVA